MIWKITQPCSCIDWTKIVWQYKMIKTSDPEINKKTLLFMYNLGWLRFLSFPSLGKTKAVRYCFKRGLLLECSYSLLPKVFSMYHTKCYWKLFKSCWTKSNHNSIIEILSWQIPLGGHMSLSGHIPLTGKLSLGGQMPLGK